MAVKHLSEDRDIKDFFGKLRKSDIIIYHPSYSPEQIAKIGRDYKWMIEYCHPGTDRYKKYGTMTCRVVDKISHNQRLIDPVDPTLIATNFSKSWVDQKALKSFK
jgi:hypothetical protein